MRPIAGRRSALRRSRIPATPHMALPSHVQRGQRSHLSWSAHVLTDDVLSFYDRPPRVIPFPFLTLSQVCLRRILAFVSLVLIDLFSARAALWLILLIPFISGPVFGADISDQPHLMDMRFSATTFMFNLERQGLEDNTFTNGLGRDTTLIGSLVNASIYKRLLPTLEVEQGIYKGMVALDCARNQRHGGPDLVFSRHNWLYSPEPLCIGDR